MAPREDLLQPIPGPKPGGANLRYDPLYDKLKEARREDDTVPQGEWTLPRKVADWPLVIKLASDALATKSKDLQIAAWLTEALARQEALAGLKTGLELLRGLLERHWDHLWPEVEDGDAGMRAAPLEWVGRYLQTVIRSVPLTKSGLDFFKYKEARATGYEADAARDEKRLAARKAAIDEKKLTAEEFDKAFAATPKAWYKQLIADLSACGQALHALDALGQEKFGDAAPNYTELQRGLEEVGDVANKLLAKKLEVDPDPPDAGALGSAGVGAGSAGESGGRGPLAPEPTSAEDAAGRIAGAVRFLRRADPRNPAPYLIVRGFRWGELRARGGEVDPKLLVAPPTQLRTHLKGLLLDGKWPELLDAGEDVMATPLGRGWLDLQRYELTAVGQLGTEYDLVAIALRTALVALLRDVPGLLDLTLMDDTPTANVETRAWLQNGGLVAAAAEAAAQAGAQPVLAVPPTLATMGRVFERAMDEVRAGRPQKGVELLMRQAEQEKSERTRFLCRSEAAGIMVEAGLEAVAMPILKDLVDEIEAHKLEDWEAGDVVARPMGLLYRCLQKLGGDAEARESLYRRVCRLDPLQAIAFPSAAGEAAGGGGGDATAGG